MFRERVDRPIDPIPQVYADRLCRLENEPDYRLTSLGAALLKSRVGRYEGISGVYYSFEYKTDAFKDFVERVKTIRTRPLYCYYIYNQEADVDGLIDEELSEFKERKNIQVFIKEKAECECKVLYHEKMNAVGIFVNSRDFRLYHLLMSFMSLYYPALFAEHPMTEEDYSIVKALSNKEKEKFYVAIKNLLKPYAMEFRRYQLSTLMKDIHEVKVNNAFNTVEQFRRELRQIEENYGRTITSLKAAIVTYEGLKATEQYDDPEEDLVEYLATNNNIHALDIRDKYLIFSVTTLLNNFNEQAWNAFKARGAIYDGQYNCELPDLFKDKEKRKLLFDNIFSDDPVLFVKMCGNYKLDLDHCRVSTNSGYDYEAIDPMFKDYLPNPHLKIFECLGGYKDRIMPALRDREYISAVEICMASAGSVNLDEVTQTFRPFLGWILTSNNKIIQTKDGQDMTPEEAFVYLVDKEKENEAD